MGSNHESAESRAEAEARRAEARAEAAASAGAQAADAAEDPPLVSALASARWDPLGDDPEANYDDGQPHADEDAIADRQASRDAKMEAWNYRAQRLGDQGRLAEQRKAFDHMQHWLHRLP